MLTTCTEPGCTTLVMGGRCVEHEPLQTRAFVRGRPFVRAMSSRADVRLHREALLEIARDPMRRTPALAVVASERRTTPPASL